MNTGFQFVPAQRLSPSAVDCGEANFRRLVITERSCKEVEIGPLIAKDRSAIVDAYDRQQRPRSRRAG